MGQFTLLYFASAASYTQKSSDRFSAPLPVSQLFQLLEENYPGMQKAVLDTCAVTINLDYVDLESEEPHDDDDSHSHDEGKKMPNSRMIQEGDEVAIIPPVSSG